MAAFVFVAVLFSVSRTQAQAPVHLAERYVPNAAYHVSCRVQIAGKMMLPEKSLDIEGKSHIEYDERIVHVGEGGVVDKTLRLFSSMQFERKMHEQQGLGLGLGPRA
jgi:hypothetical protein